MTIFDKFATATTISILVFSCGDETLVPIDAGPVSGEGEGEVEEGPAEGEGEGETSSLVPIEIFRNAQSQWVLDIAQGAVDVWATHNFSFVLTDNPQAPILLEYMQSEGNIGGAYTPVSVYIIESEFLSALNQSCVIASELARIVLMIPTEGNEGANGLLGRFLPFIPADDTCPWNDADQVTLCTFSPESCQ